MHHIAKVLAVHEIVETVLLIPQGVEIPLVIQETKEVLIRVGAVHQEEDRKAEEIIITSKLDTST